MKRKQRRLKVTPMTIDKYLRRELERAGWTKKAARCYVSGRTYKLETHHSDKTFGKIVEDAHNKLKIKYQKYMTNYDIVDLAKLKNEVLKQHEQYAQAVTLNADIHLALHQRYGKNVNMAQIEEFKVEYNSVKAVTA